MTRIIAGSVGGRRIAVPPRGTRPTTDRVREAMFGRLDAADAIAGARVLDGFAGSGALGLEALSRGAAHATFVESSPKAVSVLTSNVAELGFGEVATVVRASVLAHLAGAAEPYDLAFLDPPYDLPPDELAAVLTALASRLTPGGRVVLEWSSRAGEPGWPDGITPEGVRRYGETSLHYARASGGTLEA